MVREANMKQAASEKQLKEARGKVRPGQLPDRCISQSPGIQQASVSPSVRWVSQALKGCFRGKGAGGFGPSHHWDRPS